MFLNPKTACNYQLQTKLPKKWEKIDWLDFSSSAYTHKKEGAQEEARAERREKLHNKNP